jgi:putative transposase
MARGIERRDLFLDDRDREDLLERLEALVPATGSQVYAWSLMPNHFHLLLRSGSAGLSTLMRRLLTGYATAFNRRHRRTGHLYQNRFKSVLVEEEPYFLELVRYIHLNPLRAGLVRGLGGLGQYRWSGHAVLLGTRQADWQDRRYVLCQFRKDERRAVLAYQQFVAEGMGQGRRQDLNGGGLVRSAGGTEKLMELARGREQWAHDERVLGSSEFVLDLMKEEERSRVQEEERVRIPAKDRARYLDRLSKEVCRLFQVAPEELFNGGRRRAVAAARSAVGWLATHHCGIPTAAVAQKTGVSTVSIWRLHDKGRAELADRKIDVERLIGIT